MNCNKTIASLLILACVSASMLFVSGQAGQNASTITKQVTAEKIIETIFLIGIVLSPVSFILSVMAIWVALRNRRKTYNIK